MPYNKKIRALGGEVWAEMRSVEGADKHWEVVNQFVDVMMGVLARHAGSVLIDDPDLPVVPLEPAAVDK